MTGVLGSYIGEKLGEGVSLTSFNDYKKGNAMPMNGPDVKDRDVVLLNIPIVIEAWMSKNIDLLYKSVGKEKDETARHYDPTENLKTLHAVYPECCVYLSMLSFSQDWHQILPQLERRHGDGQRIKI